MAKLFVNCSKTSFGNALGVPHFLLQICAQLRLRHEIIFVAKDIDAIERNSSVDLLKDHAHSIISMDEARRSSEAEGRNAIEILPHHFQRSEICDTSIMICHDTHAFDIPWKYPNAERLQRQFKEDLTKASVVMTHFPRTFYGVEHIAQIKLSHLYLTPSPLMLDTTFKTASFVNKTGRKTLLYPAQLQEHKNHKALIQAISRFGDAAPEFEILCTGTDSDSNFSKELFSLIDEFGVADRISFLGRLANGELIKQYHQCDGVIIPSLAEGGAYVALEAIAAGKPVAINSIEAAKMHLRSVSAEVIWFDAHNIADVQSAITTLCESQPAQWFERNKRAREKINDATWSRTAELWNTVIESLSRGAPLPKMHIDVDGSVLGYF
ncbi:MAG: glycosyltransferase [Hyphomonadaceae bacterium]|nr:glycosyltransferase [Hyphomonadaceae bacterium]